MLSRNARFAVTALVLALAAAVVAPAEAKKGAAEGMDPAVALARGVTGQTHDVYAPTGETIDTTLVVRASRN